MSTLLLQRFRTLTGITAGFGGTGISQVPRVVQEAITRLQGEEMPTVPTYTAPPAPATSPTAGSTSSSAPGAAAAPVSAPAPSAAPVQAHATRPISIGPLSDEPAPIATSAPARLELAPTSTAKLPPAEESGVPSTSSSALWLIGVVVLVLWLVMRRR